MTRWACWSRSRVARRHCDRRQRGALPDGRAVMRFESRTAVITGGAIGFGRAFARALVAEGATVVIADIDVDMAERTAAELVSAGGAGDRGGLRRCRRRTGGRRCRCGDRTVRRHRHRDQQRRPAPDEVQPAVRGVVAQGDPQLVRRQRDGRDQCDAGVPGLDAGARWRGGAQHLVDGRLHERHAIRGVQADRARPDRRIRRPNWRRIASASTRLPQA